MLARKLLTCIPVVSPPMAAMAETYPGVVGTRLLSDSFAMGDRFYLGFSNDSRAGLRQFPAARGG